MKKVSFEIGFTLIEILVVMAIVAVIGVILMAIFANTLRGSNKAQILAAIKQNGQAVLENMDKTVRSADNVVCPSGNSSRTLVVVKNGIYTRYRITLPTDSVSSAPSSCVGTGKNGCIISDNPTPQASEITPQSFINRVCNSADPMSSAQILTDTNNQSGVSVSTGLFTKNTQAGSKDNVTVSFVLGLGNGLATGVASQIDPVTFQTTVELR